MQILNLLFILYTTTNTKYMFGHLTGKIIDLKPTKVLLEISGIGFNVHTTLSYAEKIKVGSVASFWIHTAVRENSIDLYGFEKEEELRIFEMLLSVSGIGPKSALTILGVAGVKAIEEAVGTGDISSLTKISGVGRKTAERIVVEQKGKIVSIQKIGTKTEEDIDVFEALKSLGYREKDIQDVIKNIPKDISGTNEKIKYALKNLGK